MMHKKIQHVSKLILEHFTDGRTNNCVKIAVFAQEKFKELYDLDLKVYAGSVAWITHNTEADNICHGKYLNEYDTDYGKGGNWNQHAWNNINGFNIDFTTWQLPAKCAQLTALYPSEPCRFKPKVFGDFLIFRTTNGDFLNSPKKIKPGQFVYEWNYELTEEQWRGHI